MSSVGFKQLEALSKEFKLSKEIQVDATELRIRAERRLGEMLKVMEKNRGGGDRKSQNYINHQSPESTGDFPVLANLGITKNDSSNSSALPVLLSLVLKRL